MSTIKQKDGESRENYLHKARRYCRRRFNELRAGDYRYAHSSHAVAQAMEDTEKVFPDLGTFGVEGDCSANGEGHITIQYLNSGDTYAATLVYWRGRFLVSSWGDIVEHATM